MKNKFSHRGLSVLLTPVVGLLLLAHAAPAGVLFTAGSDTVNQGGSVTIPITVDGFSNVALFQFTLQWDSGVLQYSGVGNFGLPGLTDEGSDANFGHPAANQLTVSWDSGPQTLVQDATLFTVTFNAIGTPPASSTLDFTGTREVMKWNGTDFEDLGFQQAAGAVTVVPEPVNLAVAIFGCVLGTAALVRRLRAK